MFDNSEFGEASFHSGQRFVKPHPVYHRICWSIWRQFFGARKANPGPAARADLEAAKRTWERLDPEQRDFLQTLYRYDPNWCNPADVARLCAIKAKHRTMTGYLDWFRSANKELAIERGLIDPCDSTDEEDD